VGFLFTHLGHIAAHSLNLLFWKVIDCDRKSMYYVYILYSSNYDRYYIGQTNDLKQRVSRHSSGYVRSTRHYLPMKLVYSESYASRAEAMRRETELKSKKSKIFLAELVDASR